eukprot:TRINITY_DN2188_c1_g2_i1.p1 TRINITY_DN2188_c1_g2~~TRINITY_DN2188_c1_g2_i1.p1  ORF type:complete len:727 (+),score=159.33 TRINITY_DN2188_c1_g2_i1:105-2183(+)
MLQAASVLLTAAASEWSHGTLVGPAVRVPGSSLVDLDSGLRAVVPTATVTAVNAPHRVKVRVAEGYDELQVTDLEPVFEQCSDDTVNGTGLAINPFSSTKEATFGDCCAKCTAASECAAWTWHTSTHMCYLANVSTPHDSKDAISGPAPKPPAPTPAPPAPKPPLGYLPNIVFILTDDQDRTLGPGDKYTSEGSLESMPGVKRVLTKQGAFFSNYHVNTPICCPSRTEFFTGRYFHNVRGAGGQGCMHANTTHAALPTEGMFGLLTRAGYRSGIFGKTTNDQLPELKKIVQYGSATYIDSPVDYNNFLGLSYFHLYENGTTYTEKFSFSDAPYGTPYQTTQIGNRSMLWLETVLKDPSKPFFLYLGPHAPHYPATPAPWYEHLWDNVSAPVTPNYNLSCPDKTQHIRQNPPLTSVAKCWEDQHFRDRWASLKSVDEIVEELDARLQAAKVADKTYIFYTGDHGYKLGQWRVGTSKQHPYETDIHVPFLVRGPGVAAGVVLDQMSGNVDLLPTMLEIVGVQQPADMDGRSMLPFLAPGLFAESTRKQRQAAWRHTWLNEYESVGTYYNDHSDCWAPEGYETKCGGKMPRGPAGAVSKCVESTGVGDGECYFVDSTHSNSWRALRIRNSTHNMQYIEYDSTWTWTGAPEFHELYDVNEDPYQMNNIYSVMENATKAALHAELVSYYSCSGATCP